MDKAAYCAGSMWLQMQPIGFNEANQREESMDELMKYSMGPFNMMIRWSNSMGDVVRYFNESVNGIIKVTSACAFAVDTSCRKLRSVGALAEALFHCFGSQIHVSKDAMNCRTRQNACIIVVPLLQNRNKAVGSPGIVGVAMRSLIDTWHDMAA